MGEPFRILSIDGGGLRGYIPVLILQYIEKLTGKPILDQFDLFAGTSTGALIACCLAADTQVKDPSAQGKSATQFVREIYEKQAKTIFHRNHNPWEFVTHDIQTLFKPAFSPKGMEKVLGKIFGNKKDGSDLTLENCLKPVYVSSYNLEHMVPLHFTTREAKDDPSVNARLFDVTRATSAAPTIFPTHSFEYPKGKPKKEIAECIDGGVYINNPSIGALVEVQKNKYFYRPELSNRDIYMLSLGTGSFSERMHHANGGIIDWVQPIIDIMMLGGSYESTEQAQQMLTFVDDTLPHYLRINVNIDNFKLGGLTNTTPQGRAYLRQRVEKDFLRDERKIEGLKHFLSESGMLS